MVDYKQFKKYIVDPYGRAVKIGEKTAGIHDKIVMKKYRIDPKGYALPTDRTAGPLDKLALKKDDLFIYKNKTVKIIDEDGDYYILQILD